MTTVADQLVTALGVIGKAEALADKWDALAATRRGHRNRESVWAPGLRMAAEQLRAVLRGKVAAAIKEAE